VAKLEQQRGPHIEAMIVQEARRFDLAALIDLLHSLGYDEDAIELRSHQTTLQQSAVVDAVRFDIAPIRRVVITVNLGWLAPQSALPNYFRKALQGEYEEDAASFLNFFSHHLLRASSASAFPERDAATLSDWGRSRSQLRSLLGPRSLSTLHWVFSLCFPEMEVSVKRTILQRTLRTRGMVIGEWLIGDGATCGGLAQVPVAAIAVTLLCDEPHSGTAKPWAIEAKDRLTDDVFPALAVAGLFLHVVLVLRDQSSFMVLQPAQYLGYEPLKGPPETVVEEEPAERSSRPSRPSRPSRAQKVSKAPRSKAPESARKIARSIVLFSGETPRVRAAK
jgi:hypothetical protein